MIKLITETDGNNIITIKPVQLFSSNQISYFEEHLYNKIVMIVFVMKKITDAEMHKPFDFKPKQNKIPDIKFKMIPNDKVKFSKNSPIL